MIFSWLAKLEPRDWHLKGFFDLAHSSSVKAKDYSQQWIIVSPNSKEVIHSGSDPSLPSAIDTMRTASAEKSHSAAVIISSL